MERAYSDFYAPGEILAGRYRVLKLLGAGGMGVVVACRHVELDALVAVKLLRPEVLGSADVVARFAREARAAVKITSEHVARVSDVGTLSNGAPYMVMEHLDGKDLAALVTAQGALPIATAIDYVLQACEAIAEAHSLGIVHRDLKPGNLFLSRRADGSEIVKVLDFGISKMADGMGPGAGLTSTSAVLGSPTHMSPEQLASSRHVDARTDIWALGVILHEVLSGRLPFLADTLPELLVIILQQQPARLSLLRHDIPPRLEAVVLRCLEKDRDRRYQNVGELAEALKEFALPRSHVSVERILRLVPPTGTGSPLIAGQWQPSPTDPVAPNNATPATWGNTGSTPKRKRPWLAVALPALAVVAAGSAFAIRSFIQRPSLPAAASASARVDAGPGASLSVLAPAPAASPQVTPAPAPSIPALAPEVEPAPSAAALPARPPESSTGLAPARQLRQPTQHSHAAAAVSAAPASPKSAPPLETATKPKPAGNDWDNDRR